MTTPSTLESALAKLRECADKTMFAEVTHEEAAALLARLDAADRLAQCVYALSDPADELCGVYPGPERDELKEALADYRNQRPAAEGSRCQAQ